MFITFEGIDGSGKSTQAYLLAKYLAKLYGKNRIITTREPGGTTLNELIRTSIVKQNTFVIDQLSEMMFFIAMRRDHFVKLIKPSLLSKKIIICDRFIDSSIAYQGYGYNLDLNLIKYLNSIIVDINPSLTFVMNDDINLCLKRAKKNRYECMNLNFFKKVQQGFQQIVLENPKRCHLIENRNSDTKNYIIMNQHNKIVSIVNNYLQNNILE